jgi:hypothetical protein
MKELGQEVAHMRESARRVVAQSQALGLKGNILFSLFQVVAPRGSHQLSAITFHLQPWSALVDC